MTPGSHSLKPRSPRRLVTSRSALNGWLRAYSPQALTIVISCVLAISTLLLSCLPDLNSCIRTPDLSLLLSLTQQFLDLNISVRDSAHARSIPPRRSAVPSLSSAVPPIASPTSFANLINNVPGLSAPSRTNGTLLPSRMCSRKNGST